MTNTTCTGRNGTYCCTRVPGHDGSHESYSREYNARNVHVSTTVARWDDAYGPVRFRTITAKRPR